MPTCKLVITKKPLTEKIPDIKPAFGKFDNLHLELLENKKKLKPGLPLIPVKRTIVKPAPQPQKPAPQPQPLQQPQPIPPKQSQPIPQPKPISEPPTTKSERPKEVDNDMKDFLDELGLGDAQKDTGPTLEDISAPPPEPEKGPSEPEKEPHQPGESHPPQPEEHESQEEPEEPEEVDPRSPEEIEEDERQEYLVKMRILRKKYPNYDEWPEYTPHTDYRTIKKMYNDTFRMINLEENVNTYKMVLYASFIGIEMFAVYKLGMTNLKGFANYQINRKNRYDAMLIELGEKSYMTFAMNWPVEVRLIGMILFDAAIFYLVGMASEYMGEGVAAFLSMLTGVPVKTKEQRKSRMRGPSTKPEDIRNMNL